MKFRKKLTKEISKELLIDISGETVSLLSLFTKLADQYSVEKLCKVVTNSSLKLFKVEGAAIFLLKESNNEEVLVPCAFKIADKIKDDYFRKKFLKEKFSLSTDSFITKAFKKRKISVFEANAVPKAKSAGFSLIFSFPIEVKKKTIGMLTLGRCSREKFSAEELNLIELLATYLGLKIEKINIQNEISKQKNMMEIVHDTISEGLSLFNAEGKIIYANKAVGKLLSTTKNTVGLERNYLLKHWKKYHRYSMTKLYDSQEMFRTVYEKKKPYLKALLKINSPTPRFVEADYFPLVKNKKFNGMAATYRDVTKLKLQEAEIEKKIIQITTEKERWKAIFDNVEECVCLIDREQKILHFNSVCENFLGKTISEVRGLYYYKVFNCHTKNGLFYPEFQPLKSLLITKEPISYDEHLQTNSKNEDRWVGMSASPILNSKGEIEEIILIVRDINTLKETEKAKSEFVSIASHELRTPLTVINGYLSLLLSGDLGDFKDEVSRSNLIKILQKAANETSRLNRLVADLLNVSRIEEKRIELEKHRVDIEVLINEVVEELQSLAKSKNIQINTICENSKKDHNLVCDRGKIYQAILNLLDNAIKYTPSGTKIKISDWIENNKFFISISDNGQGIPKELHHVIFEKFQQAPGSYLKQNTGTGLGLFIVKSFIELHGGSLRLDSEVGKGTTFTFDLPLIVA